MQTVSKIQPKSTSTMPPAQNIADVLYHVGVLTRFDYDVLYSQSNAAIERYVRRNLKLSDEVVLKAYSIQYKLPIVALTEENISADAFSLLTREEINRYQVIPYAFRENSLDVAVANPGMLESDAPLILTELSSQHDVKLSLALLPKSRFDRLLDRYDMIMKRVNRPMVDNHPIKKWLDQLRQEMAQRATETAKTKQRNAESDALKAAVKKSQDNKPKELPTFKFKHDIPFAVLSRFPADIARQYKMIVFETNAKTEKETPTRIKVAMVNPEDKNANNIITFISQEKKIAVELYKTDENSFERALGGYKPKQKLVVQPPKPVPQPHPVKPDEPIKPLDQSHTGFMNNLQKAFTSDIGPKKENETVLNRPVPATNGVAPTTGVTFNQPNVNPYGVAVKKPEVPVDKSNQPIEAPKGSVVVNSGEIKIRPEGAGEAGKATSDLEETNLDKFLNRSITAPEMLAEAFRSGLVPQIVASLVSYAVESKASDIHIEPEEKFLRVRYRIDGELKEIIRVPLFMHAPIVSRIKILSKLKIDEQRIPQDGRFDVTVSSHEIDLRVSTLPTIHGEKAALRVLDKSSGIYTLEQLGITGSAFDTLIENIKKPYGIILSTGPTGSGKSTTLYAVLKRITKPGINIITLEDPVEYELEGINQCQVKPKIGFTFAEGLRSVLRQDPNVIMVGEIRDLETAGMATHAALTGHLVLSTLHTNDAAGALPRMINMGVEPFLITSSINAVVGQRLVRRLCQKCKKPYELPDPVKEEIKAEIEHLQNIKVAGFNQNELHFYHGQGCSECTDGYKGRIGIYEVMGMSPQIEMLAIKKKPSSEIKAAAIAEGMITMKQDGILKALKGVTTIDEVLRVTSSD